MVCPPRCHKPVAHNSKNLIFANANFGLGLRYMSFAIFVLFYTLIYTAGRHANVFVFVPEGQLVVSLKIRGVTRSTNVGQTQCERVDLGLNLQRYSGAESPIERSGGEASLDAVALTPWGTGARAPTFTNCWALGHRE